MFNNNLEAASVASLFKIWIVYSEDIFDVV